MGQQYQFLTPFAVQVTEKDWPLSARDFSYDDSFAGLSLGVSMLFMAAVLNCYTSWLLVQMSRATGAETYEVCPRLVFQPLVLRTNFFN